MGVEWQSLGTDCFQLKWQTPEWNDGHSSTRPPLFHWGGNWGIWEWCLHASTFEPIPAVHCLTPPMGGIVLECPVAGLLRSIASHKQIYRAEMTTFLLLLPLGTLCSVWSLKQVQMPVGWTVQTLLHYKVSGSVFLHYKVSGSLSGVYLTMSETHMACPSPVWDGCWTLPPCHMAPDWFWQPYPS